VSTWTGCAHFESKPLSASKNADIFQQRTMEDSGLKEYLETNGVAGAWPIPTWDLKALTLAAFYYHPDLDVARAKWAAASAGKKTAAERPNPTLNVAPAYNTTTLTPSPWLVTVTLDIPIETAGKRGYRIAAASQLSEVARLNIASVAWQVRSRLRQVLLSLYAAREAETLLKAQQGIQTENVQLLEQQQAAGAISAFELTQARIAADGTRLVLRDAERQRVEAQVQLANSVGVPTAALTAIQLSFAGLTDLPNDVPEESALRQALLNRPDILGAMAEYNASQSALQLEIAKQYPDIHFNPGYEFDQGDNKWTLGISVELPILNQNQGPIAEASAKRQEAAAHFNALQAKIIAEIDNASQAVRVAEMSSLALHTLAEEQAKRLEGVAAQLRAGAVDQLELLNAQNESLLTELAEFDGRLKLQQAIGALEDAVRRPFELPAAVFESTKRDGQ